MRRRQTRSGRGLLRQPRHADAQLGRQHQASESPAHAIDDARDSAKMEAALLPPAEMTTGFGQHSVDALEAKLEALLRGGPRYAPPAAEEVEAPDQEPWGRAEGCAAVGALLDARAYATCDLEEMHAIVGVPPSPESVASFVQDQFLHTFRSKHIAQTKLDAFCACVDEACGALPTLKNGERGQARCERLALLRDALQAADGVRSFDAMAVVLQALAKDGKLESVASALPPVGSVIVPVKGGALIARLPKLATDDPRAPPRTMALGTRCASIETVVKQLAARDLLPEEEVLRYVLDELDVMPAEVRRPPVTIRGVLRLPPATSILDELCSDAGSSRPGTAQSFRPGTAASSFRGISRAASTLKSLRSRSRSSIPGREDLPPHLIRLKKGLYVEVHWLLRRLSGIEAAPLDVPCSELIRGVSYDVDAALEAPIEEEPEAPRKSTVSERRAAAEALQKRMDEEQGVTEATVLKGAGKGADGAFCKEDIVEERPPTPEVKEVARVAVEKEYWGCAHELLDEEHNDYSFEEIRTITFLLQQRRLLTVNVRLPNSRTSTLRFGARKTVGEAFGRLCKQLKLSIAEKQVARLCDVRGRPFAKEDRMVQHVEHNNVTLLLLPTRPGAQCAPPLPPQDSDEEPDMSYARHLREATSELVRKGAKVDANNRWGPQKPLPNAEKRQPASVLNVAKARRRRVRLVKYK